MLTTQLFLAIQAREPVFWSLKKRPATDKTNKTNSKTKCLQKPSPSAKPTPHFSNPFNPTRSSPLSWDPLPHPVVNSPKKLWDYIKKHKLQDEKNKRNINADAALKAVFGGKSQVTMFEMTKLVSAHIK